LNLFEQIRDVCAVPIVHKVAARERRSIFRTFERCAMAGGATLSIRGFAPCSLVICKDARPSRFVDLGPKRFGRPPLAIEAKGLRQLRSASREQLPERAIRQIAFGPWFVRLRQSGTRSQAQFPITYRRQAAESRNRYLETGRRIRSFTPAPRPR
jgi:hypothetical protein